jgi:DNA anti-recombination protein RmuC
MNEILSYLIPTLGGAFLSFLFTKKKYKTEVKSNEIDNVDKAVKIWRELTEGLKKSLEADIQKLNEKNHDMELQLTNVLKENNNLKEQMTNLERQLKETTQENKNLMNQIKKYSNSLKAETV